MKEELKEELTTKMHGELKIPGTLQVKHRCWTVLDIIAGNLETVDIETIADSYEVSIEEVQKYAPEWRKLKGGN